MPHMAVRRPLREGDLGDQFGPHPALDGGGRAARPSTTARRIADVERRLVDLEKCQLAKQLAAGLAVPAGADVAGVDQLVLGVDAEQQTADLGGGAAAIDEAADHELLALAAFQLQPGLGATRHVGCVAALRDHAFELEPADVVEHAGDIAGEVFAEADAVPAFLLDELAQQAAAILQGHLAQVVAFEERHVEQVAQDLLGSRRVEGVLQGVEIGNAGLVHDDDLAVEPRRADTHGLDRCDQRIHPRGPVVAAPCDEPHLALVDAAHHAIAVELDLAQPVVADRDGLRQGGELRRHALGHGRFDGTGERVVEHRRVNGTKRGGAAVRTSALGQQPERLGDHAVGQRRDDVVLRQRPRPLVLLLEQKPRVLPITGLANAHQLPQAGQLFAVQPKDELALLHALARVADRFPRAAIPDDDVAGAVLLRRDRAFERTVRDRMVLDMDRHALFGGVVARSLRHRPRPQHAVELEPEVVVQPGGRVLLDHERRLLRPLGGCRARLRRALEVALAAIRRQRVGGLRPTRRHELSSARERDLGP